MKTKLRLGSRVWVVTHDPGDNNDEFINNAYIALRELIARNNESIENIFFECLEVVDSEQVNE